AMNTSTFVNDAEKYRTIPIVQQFFLDTMTPIQLYQQFKDEAVFLLESKDEQSPWSRYSFIGLNPYGKLTEKNHYFLFQDDVTQTVIKTDYFRDAFQNAMSHLKVKPIETHVPFFGGAVGYIGYD